MNAISNGIQGLEINVNLAALFSIPKLKSVDRTFN